MADIFSPQPRTKLNTEEDLALLEKLSNPAPPTVGDRLQTFGLGFTDAANRAYGGQGGNLDRKREDEVLKRRDAISNVLAGRKMRESDRAFEQGELDRQERQSEREQGRQFQRELLKSNQDFQEKQAELNRQNQLAISKLAQSGKKTEQLDKLFVPGLNQYALSEQDSKDTKAALDLAQKFRRRVQEMIDIRKQAGAFGGELFDRSLVDRGKQLSNDVLILYKDLAKLGVMSKSDENLLRRIIPSDPTEFSFGRAVGMGDPVMTKLDGLMSDIDSDQQAFLLERGFDPSIKAIPGQRDQNAGEGAPPPAIDDETKRKRLEELRAKKARKDMKFEPDTESARYDDNPKRY